MSSAATPVFNIQRSSDRAFFDHDWLRTYHSFSFAEYHDPKNLHWGALRVFNDDTIAGGAGFPAHPHRDMEIVTYVLDGRLSHEDSMGNHGVVSPGGVQFMSAGTGVRHAEFNADARDALRLVQMWVIPGRMGQPPSYGQLETQPEERHNTWLRLVSGQPDVDAPIRITQDATFAVARAEGRLPVYTFAAKRFGFLFVAKGSAQVNGEPMREGDAARLFDVSSLDVNGDAELVLWDLPAVS